MSETQQSYDDFCPADPLTTDWLRKQLYERYVHCECYDGDDYRLTVWYYGQLDKFTFRENVRTSDSKLIHEIYNPRVAHVTTWI